MRRLNRQTDSRVSTQPTKHIEQTPKMNNAPIKSRTRDHPEHHQNEFESLEPPLITQIMK